MQTNWTSLVFDRPAGSEIFDIPEVALFPNFPIQEHELIDILNGKSHNDSIKSDADVKMHLAKAYSPKG